MIVVEGEVVHNQNFAITVNFNLRHNAQHWKLTTVYGLCQGDQRDQFVQWPNDLQIDPENKWVLVGDFNFYMSPEDRNRDEGIIIIWISSTQSSDI
jgi:hypothetical protein